MAAAERQLIRWHTHTHTPFRSATFSQVSFSKGFSLIILSIKFKGRQWLSRFSCLWTVIQCDGHSGLLRPQEQVGRELSLPIQVSPPYSHQSQGTVERFCMTLHCEVRSIRIGLADDLGIHSDQVDGSVLPWVTQHAAYQSTTTSPKQMAKSHVRRCSISLENQPLFVLESVLMFNQNRPRQNRAASLQKSYVLWTGKDAISASVTVKDSRQDPPQDLPEKSSSMS